MLVGGLLTPFAISTDGRETYLFLKQYENYRKVLGQPLYIGIYRRDALDFHFSQSG